MEYFSLRYHSEKISFFQIIMTYVAHNPFYKLSNTFSLTILIMKIILQHSLYLSKERPNIGDSSIFSPYLIVNRFPEVNLYHHPSFIP